MQTDLNALWIKALIDANKVLPENQYLSLAENFSNSIEAKIENNCVYHSYSKKIVFIEDYAFLINALLDLYESTYNINYKKSY